jgi:hypothetical protein
MPRKALHNQLVHTPFLDFFVPNSKLWKIETAMATLYPQSSDEERLVDMLADLRHYCDLRGMTFDTLDQIAQRHHDEEHTLLT